MRGFMGAAGGRIRDDIEIAICGDPKTRSSTELILRIQSSVESALTDTLHTE